MIRQKDSLRYNWEISLNCQEPTVKFLNRNIKVKGTFTFEPDSGILTIPIRISRYTTFEQALALEKLCREIIDTDTFSNLSKLVLKSKHVDEFLSSDNVKEWLAPFNSGCFPAASVLCSYFERVIKKEQLR